MSAPTRVKLNTFTWKEKRITNNFTVFLKIDVFDDGYEEYKVGIRNLLTQDTMNKVDHGNDLGSAHADYESRSFRKMVNA